MSIVTQGLGSNNGMVTQGYSSFWGIFFDIFLQQIKSLKQKLRIKSLTPIFQMKSLQ
jgi:hypothetical protein